ncbi:hypothetical protein AVEN_112189-1 [Araneus ventricosus]|uniref:Uncharacterized protein n=1 Tax=Araneus ventricosus TaxID=182803 RepID=A0A4Y2G0I5_ARAVE|nr:hypothetical protein AVEN_112189-1 [Araneus ventricosus]
METNYNTVNVSCETLGVFPFPNMRLYLRPSGGSPPQAVTDVKTRSVRRPSGSYDVLLHRTFMINELSSKGATVFECILELPGTTYFQSKRIAYFPGRVSLLFHIHFLSSPTDRKSKVFGHIH